MGFGERGRRPVKHYYRLINQRAMSYDIARVTGETVNDVGETVEETNEFTESLWCFTPRNTTEQVMSGERTRGKLQGLAIHSADLMMDDRLTHGGAEYEISNMTMMPDEDNPVFVELVLQLRDGPGGL